MKEIGSDIISTVDNLKIYYGGLESDYELIQNESKEIIDKYIICKVQIHNKGKKRDCYRSNSPL